MDSGKASFSPNQCTSAGGSSTSDGTTEAVDQKKPLQVMLSTLIKN